MEVKLELKNYVKIKHASKKEPILPQVVLLELIRADNV